MNMNWYKSLFPLDWKLNHFVDRMKLQKKKNSINRLQKLIPSNEEVILIHLFVNLKSNRNQSVPLLVTFLFYFLEVTSSQQSYLQIWV